MEWFAAVLLVGHYVLLMCLCVFGLHRLHITFQANHRYSQPTPTAEFEQLPIVTVQLPLYNEKFVVQRLIDAAVAIDYPSQLLQIQVLDDSTDETTRLAAARISQYRSQGVWIEHHHRSVRTGFKAGALAEVSDKVAGEFVAIFDADFVPPQQFLHDTIHYFTDQDIGMVQGRWDYLNRADSLLTKIQAVMLDAHFSVEQAGRNSQGAFFNFNGTAGIWRKSAMDAAGGWQADTLTEDLDLSYRAQLAGYRFVYLRDLRCMSELPADMVAFKSQQHRWAKGGTEVMLKMLGKILKAPLSGATKFEAFIHLTSNLTHLLILLDCVVFLIPAIVMRQTILPYPPIWVDLVLFCFGGLSHFYFYLSAQTNLGHSAWRTIWLIPLLIGTTIGISRSNGRGVFDALLGRKSPFVRTPKQGQSKPKSSSASTGVSVLQVQGFTSSYLSKLKVGGQTLECGLSLGYLITLLWCVANQVYEAMPFLALFCFGFFFSGSSSLRTAIQTRLLTRPDYARVGSDA